MKLICYSCHLMYMYMYTHDQKLSGTNSKSLLECKLSTHGNTADSITDRVEDCIICMLQTDCLFMYPVDLGTFSLDF